MVDRRIKGGLVVKLWGVDTFLPGSPGGPAPGARTWRT